MVPKMNTMMIPLMVLMKTHLMSSKIIELMDFPVAQHLEDATAYQMVCMKETKIAHLMVYLIV